MKSINSDRKGGLISTRAVHGQLRHCSLGGGESKSRRCGVLQALSGDFGLNDKAGHVTCGVVVGHEVGKDIQAFGVLTLNEANSYLPQYVQCVSGHAALSLRIKWALISPIPTPFFKLRNLVK